MNPRRLTRSRKKGSSIAAQLQPGEQAVYVGRPSVWGNPYSVKELGRGVAASRYRLWLTRVVDDTDHERQRAEILRRLPELRGKSLVCWCPQGCECHADVLLKLANAKEANRGQ